MSQPIKGKISNIIDQYTVALNVGKNKNVVKGMKFRILAKTVEVKDPDTGETLGTFEFEKDRIEVTEVQEKFCLAETYSTITSSLAPIFSFSQTVQKKLSVKPTLAEVDREVKVGDEVIQVLEEAKPS